MAPDQTTAFVRRFFAQVWNARRLDQLDAYIAPAARHWGDDAPVSDFRAHFRAQVFPEVTTAFPDAHFSIEEVIAHREWVAVRVVLHGTHLGPLPGLAPTGRRVAVAQFHLARLAEGRVVEHWDVPDHAALLAQLGVTATPADVPP
jgi:predicted ester cyclase